jgi:hypothetical protein
MLIGSVKKIFTLTNIVFLSFISILANSVSASTVNSDSSQNHSTSKYWINANDIASELKQMAPTLQSGGINAVKSRAQQQFITTGQHYIVNNSISKLQNTLNNTKLPFLKRLELTPSYTFGSGTWSLGISTLGKLFSVGSGLFYSQLTGNYIHGERARSIFNAGIGYRYYSSSLNSIFGINSFIDYEFAGDNARYSLGEEFRDKYIALYANQYWPISHWHPSPFDHTVYEKVAQGYDVGMEGHVPFYPQVSLGLTYYKWFGHKINVSDMDSLTGATDNPGGYVVSATYQPADIIKLTVSRTQGVGGSASGTQVSVSLILNLDKPIGQQLEFHWKPASSQSVKSHLYDLVHRQNKMILEHYEMPLITLPDIIKVVEGTAVAITPKIEERESSLSDYYWTAYPLSSSALGATVNASNHSISFTAPAYTAASHFYHLTIHAKSGPGQISASTIVEVLRNPIPIIKILSGATNLPDHSGRPTTSGTIKFQIQGGVAPYTVMTSNKNIVFKASGTNTLKVTNNASHTEEIDYTQDISPQRKLDIADFKLTVTDAKKKKVASIIMPLSIWGSPTATFQVKVGAYTLTPSHTSAGTRYIVKPNDSVNLIANTSSGYNLTYIWDNVSSHSTSTANLATASSLYNNIAAHVTDGFGRKVDHTFNTIDSRPLPNIQELKILDYNQRPYTSATATYGNRVDYAAPHHHNSFSILLTIPQVSPTSSLYLNNVDEAYAYAGYSMFTTHVTGYNNNTVGKIAFIDTTSAPNQGETWRFHWSSMWQDSSTYLWTAGIRRTYYDGSVVYSNNGTGVCWHAYGSGTPCARVPHRSH